MPLTKLYAQPVASQPHEPYTTAPEVARPLLLCEVREHSPEIQHLLTQFLLPVELMVGFGIDPITWRNRQGKMMVHVAWAEDGHVWGLRLLNDIDPRDPLIEFEMADTVFGRITITWIEVNDPRAPRFDTDVMPDGRNTLRGTACRHLEAEIAAMLAGLAPGQVRRGLGLVSQLLDDVEQFMAALQHHEYEVEPLYYHNAILFERYGFQYVRGQALMERIHAGFAPDGDLTQRLDGSSPFRRPELAGTIRGRSWAIHDGILDEPWEHVKMIKRIGVRAGLDTAPGIPF